MSEKIRAVTVVTQQGVSIHFVGSAQVHEINEEDIYIQGDPFKHFVGRDGSGKMLFKINALCPVEVLYFPR